MPSSWNKAKRTVFSRLLCCLVNERIASCHIIPSHIVPHHISAHQASDIQKWALVSKDPTIEEARGFWLQLIGRPLVAPATLKNEHYDVIQLQEVTLLDPEDMTFPIVDSDGKILIQLSTLLKQIAEWRPDVPLLTFQKITRELESCIHHQAEAYRFQQNQKQLTIHDAVAIDWEQSLVEGNPSHPMHKTRLGVPPVKKTPSLDSILNPAIHFFALNKNKVRISGDYEKLMKPILEKVGIDENSEILVPVHELQVPVVLKYFPHARHVEYTEVAKAQASVRTVVLDSMPHLNLKLSLNVVMSSLIRTLRHGETAYGQILKRAIDVIVKDLSDILIVAHELGGVAVNHEDPLISEYFGCLVRQDPASLLDSIGEKIIICAALPERRESGEFAVNEIFNLQTPQDKLSFFTKYSQLFLRAFVPPIVKYGFAFEAHAQNTLARFKWDPEAGPVGKWELTGFIIRDYAGIDANKEAMEAGLGFKIDTGEHGTPTVVQRSMETVYSFGFSAIIQFHLHRLARVLDVHYSGEGWKVVRKELEDLLPKDSEIRRHWLGSPTSYKSQLTMKLEGKSVILRWDAPNLVLHEPQI